MTPERYDKRLKYIDLPRVYSKSANEIEIKVKQSNRVLVSLAKHLSKYKPKDGLDFERNEFLKDFVVKTSEVNESVLKLICELRGMVQEIADDSKTLIEGAEIRNQIKMQSENILIYMDMYEQAAKEIYDIRRNQILNKQA